MSETEGRLEALRRDIDEIDFSLHDDVMRRMALMHEVAQAKRHERSEGSMMRPAREAVVLRQLVDRHDGRLPEAALLRIWREIINAATALQGPLTIAVCAPEKSVAYWDMARNHFGSIAQMSLHRSPVNVLRRLDEEPGCVGLLPLPQEGEEDPWWPRLVGDMSAPRALRVIWRLPFFVSATGVYETVGAFAVGVITPEESGDDLTLAVVETDTELSRASISGALEATGLKGQLRAGHGDPAMPTRQQLFELDGFVAADDPRLAALAEKLGEALDRIVILGAYPRPLTAF